MACFMLPPIVTYVCTCGRINPIWKLFFCRHCLQLRCGYCVCHEVDSHFCSNCLENIPSSEAKLKKNRCNNCFVCPICQHTLSTRATNVVVPKKQDEAAKDEGDDKEAEKTLTKKMYYLACLSCRWTTRDVGIPDQSVATGSWPEYENPFQTRFNALLEYSQALVLQEKQEKQNLWKRKTPKQHKYFSLTDRTGLTVSMIRRQMGWADKTPPKPIAVTITPSIATDEIEELPESVYTDEVDLRKITTMAQRLAQPADLPESVDKLYPQRKNLCIKRSLRCRQCEHNIVKPEYHPTSIKYRIQLFASYHVPEVRLVKCEQPLQAGTANFVILKFINPTMHDIVVNLMDLPTREEEEMLIEEMRRGFERQVSLTSTPSLTASLSRQTSMMEDPRLVEEKTTGVLEFPSGSFSVIHRDDSAEFDEEVKVDLEEPPYVVWRKANKVSIKMAFTPNADLKANDEVLIGFTMKYTYVNTVTNATEKKDPQKHNLQARVYVKVGAIKSESEEPTPSTSAS